MLPCGMFNKPCMSLLNHSFKESWNYIVKEAQDLPRNEKCMKCFKQNICSPCPAIAYTETGRADGCPAFMCRLSEEKIRMCLSIIHLEEDNE